MKITLTFDDGTVCEVYNAPGVNTEQFSNAGMADPIGDMLGEFGLACCDDCDNYVTVESLTEHGTRTYCPTCNIRQS